MVKVKSKRRICSDDTISTKVKLKVSIKKLKIGQKEISFVQLVEILEVYFWKMLQGLPKVSKIKKRSSDYQAYIGS